MKTSSAAWRDWRAWICAVDDADDAKSSMVGLQSQATRAPVAEPVPGEEQWQPRPSFVGRLQIEGWPLFDLGERNSHGCTNPVVHRL